MYHIHQYGIDYEFWAKKISAITYSPAYSAVPLALVGLTSVFEMGTGVTLQL